MNQCGKRPPASLQFGISKPKKRLPPSVPPDPHNPLAVPSGLNGPSAPSGWNGLNDPSGRPPPRLRWQTRKRNSEMTKGAKLLGENPAAVAAVVVVAAEEKKVPPLRHPGPAVAVPNRASTPSPGPTGTIRKRRCPMFPLPRHGRRGRNGPKNVPPAAKGLGKDRDAGNLAVKTGAVIRPAVSQPRGRVVRKAAVASRATPTLPAAAIVPNEPNGRTVVNGPSGWNEWNGPPGVLSRMTARRSPKKPASASRAAIGAVVAVIGPKTGTTPTSSRSKTVSALMPKNPKTPPKKKRPVPG